MKASSIENVFFGLFVGCIISVFMTYNRQYIHNIYLFILLCLISLLLSTINPRYSCSAYSGGLLCLLDFSMSYLKKTNVSSDISVIIFLVASLHIAEGFMLLFFGKRYSDKIIRKTKSGLLLGYRMKGTWFVPIVLGGMALPLICIIGYSMECYTTTRREKKLRLGLLLLLYGVSLICLGFLSEGSHLFKVVAAVFMLIGHETVKHMEMCVDRKNFRKRIQG